MKILFVGGPADGMWIDIPPSMPTFTYLPQEPLTESYPGDDCAPNISTAKTFLYKRENLYSGGGMGKHQVMMINHPGLDLIAALIGGYRNPTVELYL